MAQDSTASLRLVFGADSKELDEAFGALDRKLRKVGANLKRVGSSMSKNLTAPLAALATVSAKTAIDFEFALSKVAAVSGFADHKMEALSQSAQHFGAITAFTASEVAGLQLELAKLGFDSTDIVDMTDGVLSLAQAFDLSLAESAERVALNLNRFKLTAQDTTQVADVMAKAFGSSALDSEKLEEALKVVGPVAQTLGYNLEETTGILGVLANAGISGSAAGTQLTRIFSVMAKEGKDVKSEFNLLLNSTTSVKDAFTRFGARGAKIVPILQSESDAIGDLTDVLYDSEGAAEAARKKMEETTQGALKKLSSATQAAGISIGNALLPMINKMIGFLTRLTDKFNGLSDRTKAWIVVIGGVVASIGPLLYGLGMFSFALANLAPVIKTVVGGLKSLYATILANPWTALATAIAAVVTYLVVFRGEQEKVLSLQESLDEVAKKAGKNATDEAAQVNALGMAYKNNRDNLEERKKILDKLQQLQPDYFSGLVAEETKYGDLKKALNDYNKEIRKAAVQKAFGDELTRVTADLLKVEAAINETVKVTEGGQFFGPQILAGSENITELVRMMRDGEQTTQAFRIAVEGVSPAAAEAAGQYVSLTAKADRLETEIDAVNTRIYDAVDAFGAADGAIGSTGTAVNKATKGFSELKMPTDDLSKTFDRLSKTELDIESQFSFSGDTTERLKSLADAYERATISAIALGAEAGDIDFLKQQALEYREAANEASHFADMNKRLADSMFALGYGTDLSALSVTQLIEVLDKYGEQADESSKKTKVQKDAYDSLAQSLIDGVLNGFDAFAQGVGKAVEDAAKAGEKIKGIGAVAKGAFASVLETLGGLMIQVGKTAILTGGAVKAIKESLKSLNPIVAIAAGVALIALAGAVKGKLARTAEESGGVPALAEGGITTGPMLALIGDNPSGKEAVIPFEKMGQFLSMAGMNQEVVVTGRIDGRDILLSNDRASVDRMRTRGY